MGSEGDRARLQSRVVRETQLSVRTQRDNLAVAKVPIDFAKERPRLVPVGLCWTSQPAAFQSVKIILTSDQEHLLLLGHCRPWPPLDAPKGQEKGNFSAAPAPPN